MDKIWVHKDRWSKEYEDGLRLFLDYAFENGFVTEDNRMKCPCRNCNNIRYHTKKEMFEHLVLHGMMRSYTIWYHHGESLSSTAASSSRPHDTSNEVRNNNNEGLGDDIMGMLRGVYGIPRRDDEDMDNGSGGVSDLPSDSSAAQFYRLLEDSKIPLYPGCDKMSMMSFLVRFWNCKCVGGMSDKSFKEMLQLMRDSFPDGCTLPENFTQCKKMLSELGLYYNKIHACPNDCMLYYKETIDYQSCIVCGASRYKDRKGKNTPAKILRHFPLRPRLQRLYMCSMTARDMRWHDEERTKDGVLRHPADSQVWKHFDEMNPSFASESRNIRLGLASDGFSPYHSMRNPHSTWPVVLLPYNLPPWLCMKQPNMILSLLIPGPNSPGTIFFLSRFFLNSKIVTISSCITFLLFSRLFMEPCVMYTYMCMTCFIS